MSKLDKFAGAREAAFAETPARSRLAMLFDPGTFVEIGGFAKADGQPLGAVCGYGSVNGSPVYAFAQDQSENGGAVGAAQAAKIGKIFDLALKTGAPVIGVYDSNGALISEGTGALNAYGDMLRSVNNLSGVVPQLSLVLGPCAGSSAVMACCADFVIMSEKSEFFITPPSKGQGAAAAAGKSGVAHIVKPDDSSAIEAARKIVSLLPLNNLAAPPVFDSSEAENAEAVLRAACENIDEACVKEITASICDAGSVIELMPDFGKSAYTALGTLGGFTCGVVATKKGAKLCSDCCDKIAKFVSVLDSFQIPVITLVNTEGLDPGEDELCTAVRDMAKLSHVYAEATTAKAVVITGKAIGAAYVALASRAVASDYTIAWPSAVISALPPKAAVAFTYSERITADNPREAVEAAYIENEASAFTAAAGGYIDDVIDPALTRPALIAAMDLLSAKRVHKNPKKHGNIPF